jgi:Mor family transcriptional regulator
MNITEIFKPKYSTELHKNMVKRNNEIYHLWLNEGMTPNELSKKYNLHPSEIRRIIRKAIPILKSKVS